MSEVEVTSKTWLAFVSMVFGMFMAVLDIQIVASSLKEIQAGLSATTDEINWVQSSYLIAEVMIIPMAGWLTKVFSTRIVFSVSCLGFTIMSLACALSWDLNSMIIFRALQGFFGGSMIPTVFASIYVLFPKKMHSSVTVVIGLVVTVAPISGPVIGGYITEYLSWHYLFLLNIIPGALVTLSVMNFVNFNQPQLHLLKNIDFIGIIAIIISLGSIQYILEEGVRKGWFEDPSLQLFAVIAFSSGIFMIYHELKTKHPIINLFAFRDLNFTMSCILSFVLGWGLFSSVFVLPVFLGSIKGLNSLQIGEYLFVTGAFQLLSAPCAGILSKKLDLRIMLGMGLFLFGLGCALNINITKDSGFFEFFFPQAVRGFSLMFCFLPITSLAFATLPAEEVPTASGLYNLMRNLGGAIGLAVTNNWLQNGTKQNYIHFRETIDSTNFIANDAISYLSNLTESFDYFNPNLASLSMIYNISQREAYIITFNQVLFYIGLLLFIAAFFIVPFIKPSNNKNIESTH
jgi:MFS transporter, DHA2 family, multidrug resistance protein